MRHFWLSPRRVLVVYKEKHPPDSDRAKIRVEGLDTRTGRHLRAETLRLGPGLDGQPYGYHGNLIPCEMSPDHRWVLGAREEGLRSTNEAIGVGNAASVIWKRDGDAKEGDLYNPFWLPDSRRWIFWNDGTTDPRYGRPHPWISMYTLGQQKPRVYSLRGLPARSGPTGYAICGVRPDGRILLYRLTHTGHQAQLRLTSLRLPTALVRQPRIVTLPADVDVDGVRLSPYGDQLAWLCHSHDDNSGEAPEGLWVSRADGGQFHRIGTAPRQNDPGLSLFDRSMIALCCLQWQPDGKQLSVQSGNRIFSVAVR